VNRIDNKAPVLMILGPTASGKSAAAMALAGTRPIEIISVDSAQVYRDLNIGTAKPDAAERAAVPHHLIDIIDPVDRYSAARFVTDATRLVEQIRGRDREPVIVGGTMLYVKALIDGLHDLPQADAALRAALEREAADLGWPAMHAKLAVLDPETARRLKPTDSQRIQRALEICLISGRPMSAWIAKPKPARVDTDAGVSAPRFRLIALEPSERTALHRRIAARFKQMLDQGLVDEVIALRERPELNPNLPSIRSVGYRQVWQWLDNGAKAGEQEAMIQAGVAATRQLAKRQLTWLRSMPGRLSIDCLAADCADQVARIAARAESEGSPT